MEEILINGDIYIKLIPDILTRYRISKDAEAEIFIAGKEYNPEEMTEDFIENLPVAIREFFEGFGVIKKETGYNNNHNGFYQLWITGEVINMVNIQERATLQYKDIKEVKGKYINLLEFLQKAKYVGIYLQNDNKPLLEYLVSYNNVNLMRNVETGEYLIIAHKNPVLDGYYPGDLIKEVFDIDATYKNIIKQFIRHDYPEENKRN